MTGVSDGGGAFHKDFNLGPQPGDKEGENVDEDTSSNTRLTGITLGKERHNKVVITNFNYDNESVKTTMTGISADTKDKEDKGKGEPNKAASKMTFLMGITGAGEKNRDQNEEISQKTTLT
eukprot:13961695-Ditylum_brightwellii.AAC.1